MKYLLLFFLAGFALQGLGQEETARAETFKKTESDPYPGADSRNGYTIPANGHLHMLVVHVQFEEDKEDTLNSYWPKGDLPYYADWLFHPDSNRKAPVPDNIYNYTDYFLDMSLGNMHITADVYPSLITISNAGLRGYHMANSKVVEIINNRQQSSLDAPLDMEKYDRWTLSGTSAYHPKPNKANGKIDFILFIYRKSGTVSNWTGAVGGISAGFSGQLSGMGMDNGYTLSGGMSKYYNISSLVHELSHPLLGNNDYHTMSGTHSVNLNSQRLLGLALNGGWGLMSEGSMFRSINAWERDRLGWKSDGQKLHKLVVDSIPTEGLVLKLRDFVNFGDAVQIQLPHVDSPYLKQYLWVENHQKINYWDSAFHGENAECPELGSYIIPGIYMYYQAGMDDHKKLRVEREDFLKPISAEGSWDYEFTGAEGFVCFFYGNEVIYKKGKMNPLTGYNDMNDRYFDVGTAETNYVGDKEIFGGGNPKKAAITGNNKCFTTPDSYNITSCHGKKEPGNQGNIDFVPPWIEEVNGEVKVWAAKGPEESFQKGDKLGLGHNPASASINYRYKSRYDKEQEKYFPVEKEENKVYLNGISVEVTEDSSGIYTIKIRKNDWDIPANIRWCGDIVLHDTVNVKPRATVYLDQSETPNSNFIFENGKFAPPTKFTCKPASYFHLEDFSQTVVENGSTFILESGSRFEIHAGARLVVKKNSRLELRPGCELFLHDGGEVIIENGAELLRSDEANITLAGKKSVITIDGKRLFKRNNKKIRKRFRNN